MERLPYQGDAIACDHGEFRDDRYACYADRLEAGVHTLRFAARAVVPGDFAFPAASAEEMYHPETFGTSASTTFRIEP
jgi:uncharacterized protein YfaS (alpha-2-macroglobulin family)